ncbi:MAG: hypothetical protein KGZ61_12595 [Sandarakinorhabdus sp.]|nr:hypothetical protein [Sandarakinorhabdus sp.]
MQRSHDDVQDALEVLAADFAAFGRAMGRLIAGEVESFQGLSGLYGLKEDVDPLLERLVRVQASVATSMDALVTAGEPPSAKAVQGLATRVTLLDAMLDQLNRFLTIADLRGASDTSGDLLRKISGWIGTLKGWLAGMRAQVLAMG